MKTPAVLLAALGAAGLGARPDRIDLHVDPAEADAAIEIVAGSRTEAAFAKLEATEAYKRLERREKGMGRPIDEPAFRAFLVADERAKELPDLRTTLEAWEKADLRAAAERVLAYLPAEAKIRATVFPVIKPQKNSFVFETQSDPAIFLSVDPATTREQFENTVAHELHHIGFASLPEESEEHTPEVKRALTWIGAFGEGFAMLAAAGGPDVHPHEHSPKADRERWDRDVANFDADLRKVEKFLFDVLDRRLDMDEKARDAGMAFFGVQGPWYTVGWKMAVVVEKKRGRAVLIEGMRRPARLLATFDEAAKDEKLALWSPELLRRLGVGP